MGHWTPSSDYSDTRPKKTVYDKDGSGVPTQGRVRQIVKSNTQNPKGWEYYELEIAEVMEVFDSEEKLPKNDKGETIWGLLGCIKARPHQSEKDKIVAKLKIYEPLDTNMTKMPLRNEHVVVVKYINRNYYLPVVPLLGSVNANIVPGTSGIRDDKMSDDDFLYDFFEVNNEFGNDDKIRRLLPREGDVTLEGRFGNTIRFGSAIVEGAHGDEPSTQDSPNILIRTGQLTDASLFGEENLKQDLEDTNFKPVEENINSDGNSIWMTTDQKVNLDIEETNADDHSYMSSFHDDDQPKNGGKQITINSDRITFNTKRGKILGFSHDGIGFSTKKAFTVDADDGLNINSGGDTTIDLKPGGISLITPGNSRLDLGEGGKEGGSDTIYLSSECPSFLELDSKAHLESCKGANVHLDDCVGLYTDNGSYFKIGGSRDEAVIYVKGRDDVKEQHLVFGEKLTEILDLMLASQEALIDTVMSFAGIPTGAGPSGPISGGPANQALVDSFKLSNIESIRAQICDILTRVDEEEEEIPSI
jgi:hypothetical protein